MQVFINNPVQQTLIFALVFVSILLVTFYKKKNSTSLSLTQELKGFAIVAIIFSHIGYSLSSNNQFLFPFSVFAGVGVNLFLFFSGYGLTFSQLQKGGTVLQFYGKRLLKLFIPFWIVLSALFVSSYFFLGETYSIQYVTKALLGIFTSADMNSDINSPFWYFSLILFYYLLFPLVFLKRYTWITATILYIAMWLIVKIDPPSFSGVIGLYQVHMLAFPLGVLTARYIHTLKKLLSSHKKVYAHYERFIYPAVLFGLTILIGYLSLHANIGERAYIEETTSVGILFFIILLFMLKKRESKLLSVFGFFSYEIYLFHWPLLYHYDFIYIHLPASLATLLYLGIFLALAVILKKLSDFVLQKYAYILSKL